MFAHFILRRSCHYALSKPAEGFAGHIRRHPWSNSVVSRSGLVKRTFSDSGVPLRFSKSTKLCTESTDLQLTYQHLKKFCEQLLRKFSSELKCRSTKRVSSLLSLTVPGIILASGFSSRLFPIAQCKSKHQTSRLAGSLNRGDEQKTDPSFQWKLFFNLLWEDIFFLIGAVIAAIAAAVVNIQIPLMLGEVTNIVSRYTSAAATEVGSFLSEIQGPALKLSGIYALQGLLTFTYISLLSVVGENLAARLRKLLFHSLLEQDIDFFDTHKTGELVDRLTSDVQEFKSSFKLTISQGLRASTQTVGCIASLFMISTELTIVMLGVIPLVIVGGSLLGSVLRKLSRDAQEQISKSTAIADEALGNVRTVRAFAMEKKEFELYEDQVDKSSVMNIRLGIGVGAFQGAANIFLNGIVLGSLFAGGWLVSYQKLKAGDLISFLVATQMIERSMAQLSLLFGNVIRGLSAGARVFEYINCRPKIPLQGGEIIPFHSLMGDIEFSNVGFHYPSRPGQEVLTNFNLKVPGGKMLAVVGLSGAGKSTLAVLLERFYDVTSGKIALDGRDIRELDPSWLRGKAIGFINQEPVLFATTVLENIRYGRPDATDEEVVEAAKLANADGFISKFPQGYATVLGERGVTVSGGQKQRIAIARALVKNPSILVLDEATSALDAESERVVQEALDRVVQGRTTVVIAHRLSTVRDADIIAVVSKGRIMELGTHLELKAKKGLYWELIKKQELEDDLEKS